MSGEDYCDAIRTSLCDEFGLEEDIAVDTEIFSAGLLDSMDVLKLIMLLEQNFSIKVPVFEASIDMFDSINKINDLIAKYKI